MFSRGSSLLPSSYADARSSDDRIAFEGRIQPVPELMPDSNQRGAELPLPVADIGQWEPPANCVTIGVYWRGSQHRVPAAFTVQI